jgi:hypothetical protein
MNNKKKLFFFFKLISHVVNIATLRIFWRRVVREAVVAKGIFTTTAICCGRNICVVLCSAARFVLPPLLEFFLISIAWTNLETKSHIFKSVKLLKSIAEFACHTLKLVLKLWIISSSCVLLLFHFVLLFLVILLGRERLSSYVIS